jgi:nanoRNase/pAp phosphatase (c-di-AMP/oligoRNAs hydrolase)
MRNPWREFDSVPLGTIFKKFGGGGHQRVASVVFNRSNGADPEDVLNRVVATIKQHDRASSTSSAT